MELKQSNIKGFFYVRFFIFTFPSHSRPRWCWQFELRKFVVKKFVLATKSKNLGASWPQGFFSKVEPCFMCMLLIIYIFYVVPRLLG